MRGLYISVQVKVRGFPLQWRKGFLTYEGVSKSFRTGRLERELQMVHLSAIRCICIDIL